MSGSKLLLLSLGCLAYLVSGCLGQGHGQGTFPISGIVTYDGKPIPSGTIRFVRESTPEESSNPDSPPAELVLSISGGSYRSGEGEGISPGFYQVEISGTDPGSSNQKEPFPPYKMSLEFFRGQTTRNIDIPR